MSRSIKLLLAASTIFAAIVVPAAAHAAAACTPACITISGTVTGPKGEAVPSYTVLVQNASYNTTAVTDSAGVYSVDVPAPAPAKCYQIAGQADAYYANIGAPAKTCVSQTIDLSPMVRIQSFSGVQKQYYPDASRTMVIPVDVRALSRTPNAPWANDAVPFEIGYKDPTGTHPGSSTDGTFTGPVVDQIAAGVWRYTWSTSLTLPAGSAGYWDMDFGRDGSPFSPMMECRMVWFGYGTESVSPSKPAPGQAVTISGRLLGNEPGTVVLKGSGQVTTITGSSIVSWSDSSVTFLLPPLAKTGWASLVPPSGVRTNAQYIDLGVTGGPTPVKI